MKMKMEKEIREKFTNRRNWVPATEEEITKSDSILFKDFDIEFVSILDENFSNKYKKPSRLEGSLYSKKRYKSSLIDKRLEEIGKKLKKIECKKY